MGKVKVGPFFYLTSDILTKVLQKWSLSSFSVTYEFCPILIGCPGNLNIKFAKKYSKIFSSEAIRGGKAETFKYS